jgi:hypothetical protein
MLFAVVFACMPFLLGQTECPGATGPVTLVVDNDTTLFVTEMVMRPASAGTWTPDQLQGDGINPGSEVTITGIASDVYDLQATLGTAGSVRTVALNNAGLTEGDYRWTLTETSGGDVESVLTVNGEPTGEERFFDFIEVLDADGSVAGLLTPESGEQIVVLGDKDDDGILSDVRGGAFVSADGTTFTFWYGPDDAPQYAVSQGWVFEYTGFGANGFDMVATSPTGEEQVFLAVPYSSARSLARPSVDGAPKAWGPAWKSAVNGVAEALELLCCASAGKVGITTGCCDTDFLADAQEFTGDAPSFETTLSTFACLTADATECGQTAAEAAARVQTDRDRLSAFLGNVLQAGQARRVTFDGATWWARGEVGDPGRNAYDGSPATVDESGGTLSLNIRPEDLTWFCADVASARDEADAQGRFAAYGTYRVWLEAPLDALDDNVVVDWRFETATGAGFATQFFAPGSPAGPGGAANGRFAVLPFTEAGGAAAQESFSLDLTAPFVTAVTAWEPGEVRLALYQGFIIDPDSPDAVLLAQATFTDDTLPGGVALPTEADVPIHGFRTWLADANGDDVADPPVSGDPFEAVVHDIDFEEFAGGPWYERFDFADAGVTGYWPFDSGFGDRSGNGNTPVNVGVTTTAGGQFGGAALVEANEYLQFVSLEMGASPATWTFWYRPAALPADGSRVFGFDGSEVVGRSVLFGRDLPGDETEPLDLILAEVGAESLVSETAPAVDTWYHVALVLTPASTTLYLDGVEAATGPGAAAVALGGPFMGSAPVPADYGADAQGLFDELVAFNRALAPEEVVALTEDSDGDGLADFWDE